MHTILQTQRLIIREFSLEEETVFLDHYYNDEEVLRYLPKRSREERSQRFREAVAAYSDDKRMGAWGIYDKADGSFMGGCLLRPYTQDAEKIELGYSLERKHWGKGYGTEMAKAMIDYVFDNTDKPTLVAVTELENIGSQRVLEKAGFKRMANVFQEMELTYFEVKERPAGINTTNK